MNMTMEEFENLTPFELDIFIGNFIRQKEKEENDRKNHNS